MKSRDASVEVYRVLLMFGICLLHALDQGGLADDHRGLDNLVHTSLVGFVFISGWYGIRFSWIKVVRLLGVALYCGIALSVIKYCALGWEGPIWYHLHRGVLAMLACWFLWAYIGLMFCSPVLEPVVDRLRGTDGWKPLMPFFVLIFVWSYLALVPFARMLVPSDDSFGPRGVLTFMGIYLVARYCSVNRLDERCGRWACFALPVLAIPVWLGCYHMSSPFALAYVFVTFSLFKRIRIPMWLSKICNVMSPSLFSIYLIHANDVWFSWIRQAENLWIVQRGMNYYVVSFVVASAIFVSCFALDIPRRGVLLLFERLARRRQSCRF